MIWVYVQGVWMRASWFNCTPVLHLPPKLTLPLTLLPRIPGLPQAHTLLNWNLLAEPLCEVEGGSSILDSGHYTWSSQRPFWELNLGLGGEKSLVLLAESSISFHCKWSQQVWWLCPIQLSPVAVGDPATSHVTCAASVHRGLKPSAVLSPIIRCFS